MKKGKRYANVCEKIMSVIIIYIINKDNMVVS